MSKDKTNPDDLSKDDMMKLIMSLVKEKQEAENQIEELKKKPVNTSTDPGTSSNQGSSGKRQATVKPFSKEPRKNKFNADEWSDMFTEDSDWKEGASPMPRSEVNKTEAQLTCIRCKQPFMQNVAAYSGVEDPVCNMCVTRR